MKFRQRFSRTPIRLLAVTTLAVAVCGVAAVPSATGQPAPVTALSVAADAGTATPIPGYLIQSSSKVSDDSAVTKPGFPTSGWVPVSSRSTVYAGLLANGKYPDPFYSTNMKNVNKADFSVPWWYKADLNVDSTDKRTYLDFSGVLSRADVWVNGTKVADSAQVRGAYTRHDLDITAQVKQGANAIALKIYPNNPNADLTMGWIDWAQTPPDQNMGIVRDLLVRRSGPVALRGAHVNTKLATNLGHADLTAKVDVRNDSSAAVTATVSGTVAGVAISQNVSLAAKEKKTVTFGSVGIDNPDVWWPAGMGGQHLYDLKLTASVAGAASDVENERFGVRDIKAPIKDKGRLYTINFRPLLVLGGGYSPDLFLRWDPVIAKDRLKYVLDMGMNTVRLEGHIEPDEFFEMADELGVLTMPGWECCDKWEGGSGGENGQAWTAADHVTAKLSMTGEAERLRNHPSVMSFHIGSDFAPNGTIEKEYLDAINAADFSVPVIPAASAKSSPQLGSSGMKMNGPYDYVPPVYWYDKAHADSGGAWGFNSETSAGVDIPTMDTLNRMMSASELDTMWKSPSTAQYHRSQSSTFANLKLFGNALNARYGNSSSLQEWVKKAQLAQYENIRAEYESHARNFTDSSNPSTGLIYWMLNSGWTSLHWQLFDRYMDQGGSYYGAKKANEPVHIQYSYDTKSVVVINKNHGTASGLTASVKLYNTDGTEKFSQTANVSVPGDGGKATALTIPSVSGLSTTYLAKLVLTDSSGAEVSRNVYWLSSGTQDALNWSGTDWYYTPMSSSANLTGLSSLAQTTVSASASSTTSGDTTTTKVTLKNTGTGKTPAFYLDAHVVVGSTPVLPIQWNDNAVSLWPGEQTTLTATYRTADLKGGSPSVRVTGYNTATQTVPAGGGGGGDQQAPTVPGGLQSTGVTSSSVALAWNASTDNVGVTGYDIQVNGADAGSTSGTTFIATGLAANTEYSFKVRAKDAAGNVSAYSAEVKAKTSGGGDPGTPVDYQAEDATIVNGVVESNHAGFTGSGFVNYDNVVGSSVEWTVNAAAAGTANVVFRFANGTTANRPMDISVNGTVVSPGVSFPGTGAWTTWVTKTVTVQLTAGVNKIKAVATTANGGPNVDKITA
ncbi:exo-1,4-beta-D-glucosaminidase [Amycolatopsis xylanica]|uniref:Exo-1,4-beta-D-glucosaminidase n=1 Tax=Amycolatopsis xylanica TaxID=589385 RepID=A0A1H3RYS9_9PSEU|nr:carbohydrate-binding protein [Amycolatopsis xylanica]SDZ30834.1 exo-1,4-beta-D-glucosaminidase [Amycolatopsis xylanica]